MRSGRYTTWALGAVFWAKTNTWKGIQLNHKRFSLNSEQRKYSRIVPKLEVNAVPSYARIISLSSGNVNTTLCRHTWLSLQWAEAVLGLINFNSAHLPYHTCNCKSSTYADSNANGKSFCQHNRFYVIWLKLYWQNNYLEQGICTALVTSRSSCLEYK